MVKINRKMEYSLMALMYLSKVPEGELTQVKAICDSTGSPFDATSKVMQQMVSAGVLKSEQGAHGGYKIITDLSGLSYYRLAEIVLGSVEVAKCVKSPDCCSLIHHCNIYTPILGFNQKVAEFYQGISVQDLLGGPDSLNLAVKDQN